MKRISNTILLSILTAFILFATISCEDDSQDIENKEIINPADALQIDSILFDDPIFSEDYGKVTFSANAKNAESYLWDFANGQTDTGSVVSTEYILTGNYWVKCTVTGPVNQITDSIYVQILEIEPPYNEFFYKEPLRPFPQHVSYNSAAILPSIDQTTMDEKVITYYRQWRNRYLRAFDDSMYYVYYTREYSVGSAISCSEGHGFGMAITALMAGVDSTSFDDFVKLYRWYYHHRSYKNPNLMAWQQNNKGNNSSGATSATDGDLDIAYALLLAHYQWGSDGHINFLEQAKKVIEAIYTSDISSTYKLIELGDWVLGGNYGKSTRPCDFMLDHLRTFQKVTGDTKWAEVIDTTYSIINTIADSVTGLYPDFAIYKDGKFQPCSPNFLEGPHDGDYYYNSCRAPWRIATDYIVYGNTDAKEALLRLNRWIIEKTNNNPGAIKGGYRLDGTPLNSWTDMAFTAPFGVCAMVDAENQEWLDKMWTNITNESINNGAYFGNSIKMLCLITMSGNWWLPIENK